MTNAQPKKKTGLRDILMRLGPALALILMFAVFTIVMPGKFLRVGNLMNVLKQASINCMIGAGMLLCLITAGIDLSEEGFHIVDGDEADEEAQLYENGSLDSYDADALNEDGDATAGSVPEVDEANALEELEDGQDDDVQDVVIIEPSAEDDGYELVELELDDDDIVRYIEDEDGDVIGFVLMEDGEEAEYYYVEEDEEEAEEEDNPYDLGITKEGVAEATNDMNAIYKDGIAVAAELKGAFDDIKSALDFTSFLKK